MRGQSLDEFQSRPIGDSFDERAVSRKVVVNGLAGYLQRPCHLSYPNIGAAFIDGCTGRIKNALNGLFVTPRRGPAPPVGTHSLEFCPRGGGSVKPRRRIVHRLCAASGPFRGSSVDSTLFPRVATDADAC
jgi:hypothetical protein